MSYSFTPVVRNNMLVCALSRRTPPVFFKHDDQNPFLRLVQYYYLLIMIIYEIPFDHGVVELLKHCGEL